MYSTVLAGLERQSFMHQLGWPKPQLFIVSCQ